MATLSIVTGLKTLVANLPSKVNELLSSTAPSPGSSNCSRAEGGVQKLCRMVKRIHALLEDAEEREIGDRSIGLWLDELRDAAYDAEDVVEEFEHQLLLLQQLQLAPHQEKEHNFHQVSGSHFQDQIVAKIDGINCRFDEIYKHRLALKLGKNDGKRLEKRNRLAPTPPTCSLLGDSPVYGRDDDKARVVDMLLSSQLFHDEHAPRNVSVVSILGMGGVGKTTLAQMVYNDQWVKNHFEVRSWVCVSDRFDVLRLTREILETLPGGAMGLQGFNPLQESLQGKRFLLVLDDVWNESLGQWEALWRPLRGGAAGSRVLITTRNEEASRISFAIRTHHLGGLSDEDCWSLFAQCAFGRKNISHNDHPSLDSIGKSIVQKCGGLPLAIRTVGGLLFNENDENRWNDVLRSDLWKLPLEKNDILPALRLSYHYLPSSLKPCFAFCAVFPKDYLIAVKELVFFWMALGYIKPT